MTETQPRTVPEDEFFSLTRDRTGAATVLAVTGEIDALTAPQLSAALTDALAEPGEVVVVDLSGVSFFSSIGLTVLADAVAGARERDRALRVVVGESRAVLRALQISGLDRMLDLRASVERAVRSAESA